MDKMVLVRRHLSMIEKLYFKNHQEGWFLKAAVIYCEAIRSIARDLKEIPIKSNFGG